MARPESDQSKSTLRTQSVQFFTIAVTKLVTTRCLSKVFAHPSGALFFLNLCPKFGDSTTLVEANTLRFIAENTAIPVPKVYCAFTHVDKSYILIERIRGEAMAKRRRSLSENSWASIFNQLRKMIEELRSIFHETTAVFSLEGGPIHDC